MPAFWFLFRHGFPLALLATSLTSSTLPAKAEPPVPSLAEQLDRARHQKDRESVVEIARRELVASDADVPGLLTTIFQAQLALRDFPRATATLDGLQKIPVPPPAAALAEMRGDLAYAQAKPAPGEESSEDGDKDGKDADDDNGTAEGKTLDQALAAWREAVAAGPTDLAELQGKIADALDQAGRWEEATVAYRTFLHRVPDHAARQARLAVCLLNTGHAAEADTAIQAAVKGDAADKTVKGLAPLFDRLRPQLPALGRLEARIAAGNPPGGNPTLDVSTEASTVESASLERALILFRAGAPAGALVDAARADRETHGTSLAARLLEAQCLWQLGRDKEAVALDVAKMTDSKWFDDTDRFNRLRKADNAPRLNSDQASVRAYTVRATIMLAADQPVLALAESENAHRMNDLKALQLDDPEVVYAVALLRNDRAEDALLAAKRATEYAPNNPDGWAIWGRVEQETRADFVPAVAHLTRALSLREEPLWLRRRETCLRSLGRNAEADRDAKRLAQLPPVS